MSLQTKKKHPTSRAHVPFADKKPVEPRTPRKPYTRNDFQSRMGQWIDFTTPQGRYHGVIENIRSDAVLIKMPKDSFGFGLTGGSQAMPENIHLAGYDGHPYPYPHWIREPWCWCWFPIIFIVIIIPWFWW